MQSEQGETLYKKRSEVAELTNARAKSRFGLSMLLVRRLRGVTCVALLVAITNNITALSSASQRAAEDPPRRRVPPLSRARSPA
jgi:hypothetical protein